MRSARRLLRGLPVTIVTAALAACSDGVIEPGGGDASADGAANDGAPTTDSAPGANCAALLREVDKQRIEARTCCPVCTIEQCNQVAEDVCCEVTIGGGGEAFRAAVAAYKRECRDYECPGKCASAEGAPLPSRECLTLNPNEPSARGQCR